MSLIARTAGIGRSAEELQWDLNYLLQLWHAIEKAAEEETGPCLIYLESSLVVRAIRDLFQPDIGEILIDTPAIYEQAVSFMSTVMPANVNKVKHYRDDIPLFSRFQIEHQIESAYRRDVTLPSGGAIVIDHTEALVSVDVNSARATRGHDIEQTRSTPTAKPPTKWRRQLRLRDLGGLIVIDFIDMESAKNQREVENRLRDALRHDRARVQIGKISRFGLLELSRQRLQPSLEETTHSPCPRCHGTGYIRDTASTALHVLRILQEEAMKENTAAIHAQVPVDVRHVPPEREAQRDLPDRGAPQGERAADPEPAPRDAQLPRRAPAPRRAAARRAEAELRDGHGAGRGSHRHADDEPRGQAAASGAAGEGHPPDAAGADVGSARGSSGARGPRRPRRARTLRPPIIRRDCSIASSAG
jgi:Ribonuclease G/E